MLSDMLDLLEPPYREFKPLGRSKPKLGAIVVQTFTKPSRLAQPMVDLMERYPWVVPCLVVPPGTLTPALMHALWGLPIQPALVFPKDARDRPPESAVLQAVAGRPMPTVATRVAYVVRRTNLPSLGQTLAEIWGERSAPKGMAERTLRYRVRRMTRLKRHDWERVNRLITVKLSDRGATLEQLALKANTDTRAFKSWVERYLGIPIGLYRELTGWEWILEAALTQGAKPAPVPA
jgi:hypothetical protein